MKITELAKILDKQLEMLYPDCAGKWYVSFRRGEVIDGCILIGETGRGANPQDALIDYARKIRGKRMAFGAHTKDRMEFVIPNDLSGAL